VLVGVLIVSIMLFIPTPVIILGFQSCAGCESALTQVKPSTRQQLTPLNFHSKFDDHIIRWSFDSKYTKNIV
ncbi:MAG: hypothetical protein IKV33_02860, partial [Alistipes sp.]|nr:hypothetical protein [Alistipes sp.]